MKQEHYIQSSHGFLGTKKSSLNTIWGLFHKMQPQNQDFRRCPVPGPPQVSPADGTSLLYQPEVWGGCWRGRVGRTAGRKSEVCHGWCTHSLCLRLLMGRIVWSKIPQQWLLVSLQPSQGKLRERAGADAGRWLRSGCWWLCGFPAQVCC